MITIIMRCIVCKKTITGRINRLRKFCTDECKNRYGNPKYQSYKAQRDRGLLRKKLLIEMLGGACARCGYGRNAVALNFHHKDPATKEYQVDSRRIANGDFELIKIEAVKCELLCSNCHIEEHHPDFNLVG